MRKYWWVLLLLVGVLPLSSCSVGCGRARIFADNDKIADARLDQILEATVNKDQEALKAMFSKQALSEADDFDENMIALFNYVQGDIQSWKNVKRAGGSYERNADGTGNERKKIESNYAFTTSEQEYHVAISEYTIDTANPDNVGVYSFCIVSAEDYQEPEFTYWGNGEAGINIG